MFWDRVRRRAAALMSQMRRLPIQAHVSTEHHGTEYGGWTICTEGLSGGSIVYSFGVGEDISFDLSLIARYGLSVHAFDPTPKVIAWVARQTLPDQFHFHPYGIAAFDGEAAFYPPREPSHVSHSIIEPGVWTGHPIVAPVRRLSSIMRELGHDRVDILKMDIEGAEYDVIRDALRSQVEIRQWLVEFHHRFPGIGWRRTKQAARMLHDCSYRIFAVSARGEEYSFVLQ